MLMSGRFIRWRPEAVAHMAAQLAAASLEILATDLVLYNKISTAHSGIVPKIMFIHAAARSRIKLNIR